MNECSDYALAERLMEEFLNVVISFVENLTLFQASCQPFDLGVLLAARLLFDIK